MQRIVESVPYICTIHWGCEVPQTEKHCRCNIEQISGSRLPKLASGFFRENETYLVESSTGRYSYLFDVNTNPSNLLEREFVGIKINIANTANQRTFGVRFSLGTRNPSGMKVILSHADNNSATIKYLDSSRKQVSWRKRLWKIEYINKCSFPNITCHFNMQCLQWASCLSVYCVCQTTIKVSQEWMRKMRFKSPMKILNRIICVELYGTILNIWIFVKCTGVV